MNIIRVPSDDILELIYAAANSSIAITNAHIQVLENRLQAYDSVLSIECIYPEVYNAKHMLQQPFESIRRLCSGDFHIYHKYRSRYLPGQIETRRRARRDTSDEDEDEEEIGDQFDHSIYCIAPREARNGIKPVCVLALKQGNSSCEAVLFYINLSAERMPGQVETPLEETAKQEINQLVDNLMGRKDWPRRVKFAPGQLCEMPIYFTRKEVACITIHQPLSRPSISSVILQNEFDPWVSVVHGIISQTDVNIYIRDHYIHSVSYYWLLGNE
jgi:hypothetical protein